MDAFENKNEFEIESENKKFEFKYSINPNTIASGKSIQNAYFYGIYLNILYLYR